MPDWIPESWTPLLPGSALWALALYLPLSVPLGRLEEALTEAQLADLQPESGQEFWLSWDPARVHVMR